MKHAPTSLESYIENEKKRIDSINAAYSKKRNEIYGSPDLKAAWVYFEDKARSFASFFERLDKTDERFEKARTAINKDIRRKALKKFSALMDLAKLNAEYSYELQNTLHPGPHTPTHNTGLLADPEMVIRELEYDEFEPPFELQHSAINVGNDFAEDDSFPWADWGTLHTYVRFSHNHSWTEISGGTSKYGYNSVNLGLNYKMPRHGALNVTVVLKAFDHAVDLKISDNWGPSDAVIDVSHMLFFPVKSGAETKYLHSISLVDERKSSDGDNVLGPMGAVALNTPIIVNFTTGHIHEGEDLQITVASWFRIASTVTCMKTELWMASLLKVEKIYLRVIE
jgi:hypothetical protein